jgi:Na+-driven multidrug efflux pump
MFCNATGNAILYGLAASLDSLSSQSFGAGNMKRIGELTQRGLAILATLSIPVAVLWWHAGSFLGILLGDSGEASAAVALAAAQYVRFLIVGLPGALAFEVLKRHLQNIGIARPITVVSALAVPINAILGLFFIFGTPLGFYGAPLATSLCQWLMAAGLVWYMRDHRRIHRWTDRWTDRFRGSSGGGGGGDVANKQTGSITQGDAVAAVDVPAPVPAASAVPSASTDGEGQTIAAAEGAVCFHDTIDATLTCDWTLRNAFNFRGWVEFLSLGAPSAAMLFVEWGSYEAAALIAGRDTTDGVAALAGHTILAQTASAAFMPILGYSIAASTLVGKYMGERNIPAAKEVTRAATLCAFLYGGGNAVLVLLIRGVWPLLFTNDVRVAALATRTLPILCAYTLFDAIQCIASGVLRGVGRPSLAAAANVCAYLVLGLPSAYFLCVRSGWGLPGLWLGLTLAVSSAAILLMTGLARIDWKMASDVAVERAAAPPSDAAPSSEAPSDGASTGATAPVAAPDIPPVVKTIVHAHQATESEDPWSHSGAAASAYAYRFRHDDEA